MAGVACSRISHKERAEEVDLEEAADLAEVFLVAVAEACRDLAVDSNKTKSLENNKFDHRPERTSLI